MDTTLVDTATHQCICWKWLLKSNIYLQNKYVLSLLDQMTNSHTCW